MSSPASIPSAEKPYLERKSPELQCLSPGRHWENLCKAVGQPEGRQLPINRLGIGSPAFARHAPPSQESPAGPNRVPRGYDDVEGDCS